MKFLSDKTWIVLSTVALICNILIHIREQYRYRSMLTKYGRIIALSLIIVLIIYIGSLISIAVITGIIPSLITFLFITILFTVIGTWQKNVVSDITHPEVIAKQEWEDQINASLIEEIANRKDITYELQKHSKDIKFLVDLLNRMLRAGNTSCVRNARSIDNIRLLMKIYDRDDWTDKDKFIEASNLLEYGHRN